MPRFLVTLSGISNEVTYKQIEVEAANEDEIEDYWKNGILDSQIQAFERETGFEFNELSIDDELED